MQTIKKLSVLLVFIIIMALGTSASEEISYEYEEETETVTIEEFYEEELSDEERTEEIFEAVDEEETVEIFDVIDEEETADKENEIEEIIIDLLEDNGEILDETLTNDDIQIESISFAKTAEVGLYQTYTIDFVIEPEGATGLIKWESDDETIASVDEYGIVTGNARGTTVVKASSPDGEIFGQCEITVTFSDIITLSNSFKKAINWVAEKGITNGYSDGRFGQEDSCTRKQFAIMLYRYAGRPAVYGSMTFNDCQGYGKNTDTYKAIIWASTMGIIKGYDDGSFRPDNPVTRKQVLIMLYRAAGKPSLSGDILFNDCQDYERNSDTYKAILWGVQLGITAGTNGGASFSPDEQCLRRQCALFLYRFNRKSQISVRYDYSGFVEWNGNWYYLSDGYKADVTNVIKGTVNGKKSWWYVKNGVVQLSTSCTYENGIREYTIINGEAVSCNRYFLDDEIVIKSGDYNVTSNSVGLKVMKINQKLGLGTNGYFTSSTEWAVKQFQKKNGLEVTGTVDKATWMALGLSEYDWENIGTYRTPIKVNALSTREDYVNAMIETAYEYVNAGTQFIDGGSGPAGSYCDCSGFIFQCLYSVGINPSIDLVDHATLQYEYGSNYFSKDDKLGVYVSVYDIQAGDLVFYANYAGVQHVALYIGNGKVIDARVAGVDVRDLQMRTYYIAYVKRLF